MATKEMPWPSSPTSFTSSKIQTELIAPSSLTTGRGVFLEFGEITELVNQRVSGKDTSRITCYQNRDQGVEAERREKTI
jgi:hypothetical protein